MTSEVPSCGKAGHDVAQGGDGQDQTQVSNYDNEWQLQPTTDSIFKAAQHRCDGHLYTFRPHRRPAYGKESYYGTTNLVARASRRPISFKLVQRNQVNAWE